MKWLRAGLAELLGLFVADWVQAGVIVAILVGAYLLSSRTDARVVAVALPVALALQLLAATWTDAGRRSSGH